ncbi:LysR substrate-binding domain-containing protein [uncultured Aquincola sp.]|uniref:LysR substrate-binding domain-containing protein n=1 Tax=uncultured Aquincola sp. TaxID=886556 RepID=UPI0032B17294
MSERPLPPSTATLPPASALARMRLRHLQCLLAVADTGSLRRAAERLSITQPAVTKTIHELEEILGVRLLTRGRRGTLPTPEAALFLRHAQASISALGEAVRSVSAGAVQRPLRVGALPTLAPSVMARVALAWRQAMADAAGEATQLQVVTGLNTTLLQALRAQELDLVIGRLADPDDMVGLSFELLYAEPLVLAARPGHPLLAAGRAPSAADVAAWPLVLPMPGTVIRHGVDSFFSARGVMPAAGLTETVSASLGRAMTLGSDALWFTPLSAAEADFEAGSLQRLPVDTGGTEEPVGLLLPTQQPPWPALQAMVEAVRAEAARRRALAATALRKP